MAKYVTGQVKCNDSKKVCHSQRTETRGKMLLALDCCSRLCMSCEQPDHCETKQVIAWRDAHEWTIKVQEPLEKGRGKGVDQLCLTCNLQLG